jgi:hypothetical protein
MPTYTTPGPISVRVDLPLADTRIIASDRDTAVVEVLGDDDTARVDFTDDRLTVSASAPDRGGLLGWGLGLLGLGPDCGVSVVVEVPTGSRLNVTTRHGSVSTEGRLAACDVRSDYGDIHLDETGPVTIQGRHGEITVEHVTGDAEISTSSGDVRLGVVDGAASITNHDSDITVTEVAGPLQLRSSHGDMAVGRVRESLVARNAYGGVHVTELVAGTCDVATTYGDIEIGIAGGTAAWLDVRSDSGSVHNRLDTRTGPDGFDHTAEVHASTRDGDVVIRRAAPSTTRQARFWQKR